MECKKCGTYNKEDRKSCRTCGASLTGFEIETIRNEKKKEGTIEKLAIIAVVLGFIIFVAFVVNLGLNTFTNELEIKSISAPETAKLSDDTIEKKLTNTLTNCGFDVKKVEVSAGVVWFDIYNVGSWPDYQKKQLIVTLAQLAHQERKGSGGTNVHLYDEYGVKIASARHHSIDNTVINIKLY